jgi:hypothetical protein
MSGEYLTDYNYTEQPEVFHCPLCDNFYDEHNNEVSKRNVVICNEQICDDCLEFQKEEQNSPLFNVLANAMQLGSKLVN